MPGPNTMRGEGAVVIQGQPLTLRYDWTAIARLDEKYPKGFRFLDPNVLAHVIVEGLAWNPEYSEWTAERILQVSPPLMPTIDAVQRAMNIAYYGTEEPPLPPENPMMRAAAELMKSYAKAGEPPLASESKTVNSGG